MKISDQTLAILKNFATINESIVFHDGSILNTVSNAKNLMGFANVAETFPKTAAIYNLNQLLNTLGLFEDPDVEFEDTYLKISDDNTAVKYFFADESIINISDKQPKMPDTILEFVLTKEDLNALKSAASVLNLPDLVLRPTDSGELELQVTDFSNTTSNEFGRTVGDNPLEGDFNLNFKTENMKLIPGDYAVTVAGKGGRFIAQFTKTDNKITYFIALDPASSQS